jgi:hypothetical protein
MRVAKLATRRVVRTGVRTVASSAGMKGVTTAVLSVSWLDGQEVVSWDEMTAEKSAAPSGLEWEWRMA